jgi:hypothetical protein
MPKQSSAWGHAIRPINDSEREVGFKPGHLQTCSAGLRCPGVHEEVREIDYGVRREYRTRVGSPAEFVAIYNYVTGRAGRVTTRWMYLCNPCAEKWAARNKVAFPPVALPAAPRVPDVRPNPFADAFPEAVR